MQFEVRDQRNRPQSVELDGNNLAEVHSKPALKDSPRGWYYDAEHNTLWIKFPDDAKPHAVRIEKLVATTLNSNHRS